jgi:hypothetical protein
MYECRLLDITVLHCTERVAQLAAAFVLCCCSNSQNHRQLYHHCKKRLLDLIIQSRTSHIRAHNNAYFAQQHILLHAVILGVVLTG